MKPASLTVFATASLALFATGCSTFGPVAPTANPQVAAYSVTPALPANVTVEFGPDTNYGFKTSTQAAPAGAPYSVLVAGMKPNTTYHMRATVDYGSGIVQNDLDRTFDTGSTPPNLVPPFTVTPTSGLSPQPGVELVDILQGAKTWVPFATDVQGNVVWTYMFPDRQPDSIFYPIKLLSNGHFAGLIAPASQTPLTSPPTANTLNVFREFDLAGTTIRQLSMVDLNAALAAGGFNLTLQLFTHDFAALPNGHFLVLCNTLKTFNDLPGRPGATQVLGDVVVDLDKNLKPVWVWNEFDHFDVNRQPMNFPDWTHSNAITYSKDDGNFLVSIRHQNWIVKVKYQDGLGDGSILWKLGYQGDFKLEGGVDPTDWFYAQHDANFVSPNTAGTFSLAIMDNGDDRVFPAGVNCNTSGAPPCQYSTIPIMQIDENAKTASFQFHQILPPNLYSGFAGGTRVLPNFNIEYNLAGVATGSYTYEVTPTATPQTVWEMQISDANTYRSFRLPSLYPGVQW